MQFYFDNTNFPLNMCEENEKQFMNATECKFLVKPFLCQSIKMGL